MPGYRRCGVANLFMVFEPLLGWRWVKVTDRRTAVDFAEVLRELVEEIHADARAGPGGWRGSWSGTTPRSTGRG